MDPSEDVSNLVTKTARRVPFLDVVVGADADGGMEHAPEAAHVSDMLQIRDRSACEEATAVEHTVLAIQEAAAAKQAHVPLAIV